MSNKLISQLTASGSNLQDIDLIEGQINGEAFTRKFTGTQARAVEKAARELQDDNIEAGCGLQTDGSYLPEPRTWSLRAGDFAAGCVDRVGATGALPASIQNGLRLLDAKTGTGNSIILHAGITLDSTFLHPAVTIPPRYILTYIVFQELNGGTPILDLGTTLDGNEVFLEQTLTASDLTTIVIERIFSMALSTDLYLSDTSGVWDGAMVDAYFVLMPLIPGGLVGSREVVVGYYETDLSCTAPTIVILDGLIGLASDFAAGSIFLIKDINGGCAGDFDFVTTDGTAWYVNSATFNLAV